MNGSQLCQEREARGRSQKEKKRKTERKLLFYSYKSRKYKQIRTDSKAMVAWRVRRQERRGGITQGHEEILGGEGHVYYLGCNDGFMDTHMSKHIECA